MNTLKSIYYLCCFILFASFINAEDKKVKKISLYILAGQSNMVGVSQKAYGDKFPDELNKKHENVLFTEFWGVKLLPLEPKKVPRGRIGPGFSFGYEMNKATKNKIGLLKLASGGTSIFKHWNPIEFNKEKGTGVLYKRLVDYVKNFKKKNPNTEIAGMLWMQGEADCRYGKITTKAYGDMLLALIKNCRKEFELPNMKFIAARVNPPKDWRNYKEVRKAIVDLKDKNYAWVDVDKCELGKDNLHLTLNGQITLGKNYAKKMLELQNQKK